MSEIFSTFALSLFKICDMRKVTFMLCALAVLSATAYTTAPDAVIPEYEMPKVTDNAPAAKPESNVAEPSYKAVLRGLNDIIASPESTPEERQTAIDESLSIIGGISDEMAQTGAYVALAIAKSVNQ